MEAAAPGRRRRRRRCQALDLFLAFGAFQGVDAEEHYYSSASSSWLVLSPPTLGQMVAHNIRPDQYNQNYYGPSFLCSGSATTTNMDGGGEEDKEENSASLFLASLWQQKQLPQLLLSDKVVRNAWQRIRDQVVATALDSFEMSARDKSHHHQQQQQQQGDETQDPPLPDQPKLRLFLRDASRRIRDQVAPALLAAVTIALRRQDDNENSSEEEDKEPGTAGTSDDDDDTEYSSDQRRRATELVQTLALRLFSRESLEAVRTIRSMLQNFHNEHGVVDIFRRGYKKHEILLAVYALNRLQKAALLYHQKQLLQTNLPENNDESTTTTSSTSSLDPSLLQDLAHYAVYANAVYGWKMDLLALRWRRRQWQHSPTNVQVVTTQGASRTHRPAYWVLLDHTQRSIVVAVRGTWSPHDVLTDLCCVTQDFDINNNNSSNSESANRTATSPEKLLSAQQMRREPRRCGHQGMLEAAKALHRDVKDTLIQLTEQNPDHSLVLVGHSLGGGVAALLGTLLEQQYPNLRVYLYGAPCVAPADAKLHDNIVSVVTDGDPFCRLSLGHVADVSQALVHLCEDPMLRYDILLRTNHQPQDMAESDLLWCFETMETLRNKMKAEKLFPPGRILLLSTGPSVALPSRGRKLPTFAHSSRAADTNNGPTLRDVPVDYFQDLVIGPRMVDLSRHIPALYENTLQALVHSSRTP